MDQKIQSQGSEAAGVVLIAVGIMVLPVAIGMLFSFPDWIWSLGLLLLVCSYFIIAGGWKNIKQARNDLKKAQASIAQMMNENGPVMEIDPSGRLLKKSPVKEGELVEQRLGLLLVWHYTTEEWKRFVIWEKEDRKLSSIVTGVLVAVIGAVFVKLQRDASWGMAFLVAVLLGSVYALILYFVGMSAIRGVFRKQPEVRITKEAILINGVLNVFSDQKKWVYSISILEKPYPMVVEIVYKFETNRGSSQDELHFPIPKGKLGEAIRLVEDLKSVHGLISPSGTKP